MNIVHRMQLNYTHGKLISDDQWAYLAKIYTKVKEIDKKEKYLQTETDILKQAGVTELFLGADLEEFFTLTLSSKVMYSILMDLEDYFSYDLNEDDRIPVFENGSEALKAVRNAFSKLEKIRSDVDKYLTEDFE